MVGDKLLLTHLSSYVSCSTFIKGVVCTKNIKHKRMTSQYKNPRLLLLGGALEFQGVTNQLESFDVLRQQVLFHLLIWFLMTL